MSILRSQAQLARWTRPYATQLYSGQAYALYRRSLATSIGSPSGQKTQPTQPSQRPPDNDNASDFDPEANYVKPTLHVLNTFRKIFVYTTATGVSLAVLVFLGWEGTHLYVEKRSIAPLPWETDDDHLWGWNVDLEDWTGGENGGTDPQLGYKARHLLRAAWMAQYWGVGTRSMRITSSGSGVVAAPYQASEQFLAETLAHLKNKSQTSFPPPPGAPLSKSIEKVLLLHAKILERIGTAESVAEARQEYMLLWHNLSGALATHIEAGQVAVKIGNLSNRLQQYDLAIEWWHRAIEYTTLSGPQTAASADMAKAPPSPISPILPPSPPAQRTLLSALVSLSSHYAMTQQLDKALDIERSAIRLLSASASQRSTGTSTSLDHQVKVTPENAAGALHSLFLQHRSSVLSLHMGEVLYASQSRDGTTKSKIKQDPTTASQVQLHLAATTSEKVANSLTDVNTPYSGAPSAITNNLSSTFSGNPTLAYPAAKLLRDARRTAAEAWNLSGVLYEIGGRKEDVSRALECFERAVHWSGGQNALADAESDVVQREWETYWKNYARVKEQLAR